MISVANLSKDYGAQNLFGGVSIQFNPGSRYGLVGANGSGKSTLLRILSGEEEPSGGAVSIPKRARLGVLKQDHFQYEAERILDVVMMGNRELWDAMTEKEQLLATAEESFNAERYAELEDLVLRYDGYSQEARAGEILEGLGIPTDHHHQPLSILSGGFKLRVLLAQVLASNPDVLLLDEPTNHLDIVSIRWLEKFLEAFLGCVLIVSHDHRFLDNISTHIVDIDYATATLYTGNYSAFTQAKVEDRERREAEITKLEKRKAEQQAFVDRFRAKATKARQAQSKLKQIERMDIEELPRTSRRWPRFRLDQVRPSGKRAVELEGISKAFGDKRVLEAVSLTIDRGDRLAIIGPNGIGKSTLLKIMVNNLEQDSGKVEWGYEAYPGYFAQDHATVFEGSRHDVESWLWEACPGEPIGFVRGNLAQVLFSGDDVKKRVGNLSGGERARLLFCRLGVEKPNVLILDEPTNHLDMEAIESLVEGLEKYPGTLVFVSHDRWFVSRLATRILELTPKGITDFRGTYDEYLSRLGDDHLDADSVLMKARDEKRKSKTRDSQRQAPGDGKQRARRRKELERERDGATKDIEIAEARVHEINEHFCNPGYFAKAPADEVRKLEREQDKLKARIATLMEKWESAENELQELGQD